MDKEQKDDHIFERSNLGISIGKCTKKLIHRATIALCLVGRRWWIRFDQSGGQFGTTSPIGIIPEKLNDIVRNIMNLDRQDVRFEQKRIVVETQLKNGEY